MIFPVSVLDLAPVAPGESIGASLAASVELARVAEANGFERVWYAEHHNMGRIASSATSVVIAHVAAHTNTIRLGSGGVMLPNHSPLVIAEQFGTLAELHPGRIDLGVGRAPGTDQVTMRALRRDVTASDTFPQDVVELQGFLSDQSPIANVKAVPGRGTHVPIYILGSSLFGATLAGALGLPYGFASHFAPEALQQAIQRYRQHFTPSAQADRPHAIAGVNVIAAEDHDDAQAQLTLAKRQRISGFLGRGRPEPFTEAEIDALLESPQGRSILEMMRYTVAGTPDEVRRYLEDFKAFADADELIITLPSPTAAQRQRSAELTAAALAE